MSEKLDNLCVCARVRVCACVRVCAYKLTKSSVTYFSTLFCCDVFISAMNTAQLGTTDYIYTTKRCNICSVEFIVLFFITDLGALLLIQFSL